MRNAVLATEIDTPGVDGLYPVPRIWLGNENRVVVRRHDPCVVVEHIDTPIVPFRLNVHRLHALRVADVALEEERFPAFPGRLLPRLARDVGDAHPGAFRREQDRGLPPDAAGSAGDDRNLAVEPAHYRLHPTFVHMKALGLGVASIATMPNPRPRPNCVHLPNGLPTRRDVFEAGWLIPARKASRARSW